MLSYTLLALLSLFLALITTFPDMEFINKCNANNGRNLPSSSVVFIAFTNEEAKGCINNEPIDAVNKAAIDVIIAPRNPPSCFFIPCFIVSVARF